MKRRLAALLVLAAFLIAAIAPAAGLAAAGPTLGEVGGITYYAVGTDAGVAHVVSKASSISIPAKVEIDGKEYNVTKIGGWINEKNIAEWAFTQVPEGASITVMNRSLSRGTSKKLHQQQTAKQIDFDEPAEVPERRSVAARSNKFTDLTSL